MKTKRIFAGTLLVVALLVGVVMSPVVSAQQDEPHGPPADRPHPHPDVPVGDPQGEAKHPFCYYNGNYFGICGTLPGVSCKIVNGSVWGGPVLCEDYLGGLLGCDITWPNCNITGRYY